MKKRHFSLPILILATATSFAAIDATVAWFHSGTEVTFGGDAADLNSGAEMAPYGGGDGLTPDTAYVISNRRHLYNLAWLQYIGRYNTPTIRQLYFKVTAPIDMSGITLPPIGTEQYPFLGHFDGGGKAISNLTVSNDNPLSASSDFGVTKPNAGALTGTQVSNIIGFFGVVGEIEGDGLTYDSSIVSMSNITLDTIAVNSKTQNTLIGLAAGYVNGSVSDVKVGESTIAVNGASPITSITNNLSDYSLVGYTAATATASEFTKEISNRIYKKTSGGHDGGFGASINFKDITTWIFDLHKTKGYDIINSSKAGDKGFLESSEQLSAWSRYNKKVGTNYSLVFNTATRTKDPDALFGFMRNRAQTSSPYYFDYSFNVFSYDSTSGKHEGTYTETNGTSTEYADKRSVGFKCGPRTLHSSSSRYYYTIDFDEPVPTFSNVASMILYQTGANSANFVALKSDCVGNSGNLNITANRLYGTNSFELYDNSVYQLTNGNYLPINFSDNNKTATGTNNVGYIVGVGLASDTNNYGAATPRISSYPSSYLDGSVTNGEITTVKTYNGGNWTTITEEKDSNGKVTGISGVNFLSNKYIEARNAVATAIEGQNTVHGIHFDVSASSTYATGYYRGSIYQGAYTEQTMLLKSYNGAAKTTRMPKGCIDFELEDSGFITFFAGMYNSTSTVTNLNFFSLFKVNRSSPTNFTLSEIKKIYKSSTWTADNPTYVYWYDGESEPSGKGDLVFDVETALWPARTKDDSLYYFEIPVNQGEYVMGAVNQSHTSNTAHQGAYMMYLDLGSEGKQKGDNEMYGYSVTTQSGETTFPAGVDFNVSGLSIVGGETVSLALTYNSSAVTGSVNFTVGSSVDVNSNIASAYVYYNISPTSSGSITPIDKTDDGGGGGGYRLIRAHIDDSDGKPWEIEVKQTLDSNGNVIGNLEKVSITFDGVPKDIGDLPEIFTSNIALFYQTTAVTIEFKGSDFSLTAAYSGDSYQNILVTIPQSEVPAHGLAVLVSSGYTCTIKDSHNNTLFPTS